MYTKFNIHSQLKKELDEFEKPIQLAKTSKGKGFMFSQKDTLDLIEYYTNSKYESGEFDSEGRQKIFLNILSFRAEVAAKQTDIDLSHYNFIPNTKDSIAGCILMKRRFQDWAKENYYAEEVNDTVERFPKYGTVVAKKVGKTSKNVPLRNIINPQDAKSLKEARYVIEKHENMTLPDMDKYPDWDVAGMEFEFDDTLTVYERYGYVPLDWYKKITGKSATDSDKDKTIYVMAVLTLDKTKKNKDEEKGRILFMEEAKCPYEEAHWRRQDGRWLGIGVVEDGFENQKARNMVENFRKNNLQWSGKKIFSSTGDEIAQNLVSDVKDGQVINLGMTGQLGLVDTATRSTAEFQAAIQAYDQNADQKAFTYEVATGESLPSGTPFRLGVVLSNSVNSYYAMKREKLGLFLKRVYIEQILPVFKKENKKAQAELLAKTAEEYKDLQDAIKTYYANKGIKEVALNVEPDDIDAVSLVEGGVEQMMATMEGVPLNIPEGLWDMLDHTTTLEVTGETIDVQKKMETLTSLYQTQVQTDPAGAQETLSIIMALAGEKYKPSQMGGSQMMPQAMPQGGMDQMAMANAPEKTEL